MASAFPGGQDTWTVKTDNIDTVFAADVNNLQNAVAALEIGGVSTQNIAYAASITPNVPSGQYVIVGTLTGNITINAPTNALTGRRLTFRFTQDGTGGRAVTWNAIYKVTTPTISALANVVTEVTFTYDGTNWIPSLNPPFGLASTVTAPGTTLAFTLNAANYATEFFHVQANNGAANAKALMRIMPTGTGTDSGTGGEFAELTLMGTAWGSGVDWWVDHKTGKDSGGVKYAQNLTDSDAGTEPITVWTVELDINAHSANVEQFRVVRNAAAGAASGDNQIMLDIKGDTGIIGIAQTKIAVNSVKFGPTTAGANIEILLHDTASRTSFTRQTGANGDLIFRNFGTGRVILRPNDTSANDLILYNGGHVDMSGNVKIIGNVGFYNTSPVGKPTVSGSRAANAALASLLTALAGQGLVTDSSSA